MGQRFGFSLSNKDQHVSHNTGCFIDHLCDAMKILAWKTDTNTELEELNVQYKGHQREIVKLRAKADVHDQPHRRNNGLGSLSAIQEEYRQRIRVLRDLQDRVHIREQDLRRQLDRAISHSPAVMAQVYETAPQFHMDACYLRRPAPDFLTDRFVLRVALAQTCNTEIRRVEDLIKKARQDGLDLAARTALDRNLIGLRNEASDSEKRLWDMSTGSQLGDQVDLTYLPTQANLQTLQEQIAAVRTGNYAQQDRVDGSDSDLSRQSGRFSDGRPMRELPRAYEWSDTINGISAPVAGLENEQRMVRLADTIFQCSEDVRSWERMLHDLRSEYFSGLSEAYLRFPTIDRAWHDNDIDRGDQGPPPFVDEEARMIQGLEIARDRLRIAQQEMRSYIDSKPAPSEDSFREQTNDLNSGNDAPGLRMADARAVLPDVVRRWQAPIARQADLPDRGTLLLPPLSPRSMDLASVRFSDRRSWGSSSDHSLQVRERNRRWLQRNEAIVEQKRQHLENEGIVFRRDVYPGR